MKQFMFLGLLVVIFTFVYGCSLNETPSMQIIQEEPLYSSEERLALYSWWNDFLVSCDEQRLGKNICENHNTHIETTAKDYIITYGKSLKFKSLEFDTMKGSIVKLKANRGNVEVEIISIRNRDKNELKELLKKGEDWLIKAWYADEKKSFFILREWEEKTLDIMKEYGDGSLHSKEEMAMHNWVGFDLIIRPLGLESNIDYEVSFK